MNTQETQNLIELTRQVAFFLNAGEKSPLWAFKPLEENYPTQYIFKTSQPDCEIAFHAVTYGAGKGKVEIHGNFHVGQNRQFVDVREYVNGQKQDLPKICVTASRGAEKIAQEIKRRFLPEYLPMLEKATKQRDSWNAFHAKTLTNLQTLARIVNADTSKLKEDATTLSYYDNTKGYGDIQASDTSVSLKLNSLSMEKAERILAIAMEAGN